MPVRDWDAEAGRGIIRALKHVEGALLPILHAIQDEFGFIDAAAVLVIADELNLTRAEVQGVISFYHDFRREAPKVTAVQVRLSNQKSEWQRSYEALREATRKVAVTAAE
jgi:NADH:ubiquinone oxidoreductase subunit E